MSDLETYLKENEDLFISDYTILLSQYKIVFLHEIAQARALIIAHNIRVLKSKQEAVKNIKISTASKSNLRLTDCPTSLETSKEVIAQPTAVVIEDSIERNCRTQLMSDLIRSIDDINSLLDTFANNPAFNAERLAVLIMDDINGALAFNGDPEIIPTLNRLMTIHQVLLERNKKRGGR